MELTLNQWHILRAMSGGAPLVVRQATGIWHLAGKPVERDDVLALRRAKYLEVPGAWSDKTFLYAELTDEGRRIVAAEAGP